MADHTGQSSQLFADADRRNAQFLATVEISRTVSRVGLYARAWQFPPVEPFRVRASMDFRVAKLLQAVPIHIVAFSFISHLPLLLRD